MGIPAAFVKIACGCEDMLDSKECRQPFVVGYSLVGLSVLQGKDKRILSHLVALELNINRGLKNASVNYWHGSPQ